MATSGAGTGAGAGSEAPAAASGPQKVIIDTDPGVDDTMALLLALACPEKADVVGITICMGNHNDMDQLAANACLAVDLAGKSDSIVVVKGQNHPLMREYGGASGIAIHGDDGLGNTKRPFKASLKPMEHAHTSAARYLVDTCAANPGEITLITLGPLTNVAAACIIDSKFPSTVKALVMMGGTVDGTGNKAPAAEANIHNDPEAAKIVFNAFTGITMAGLNVTTQVPLSPEFRTRIRDAGGAVGEYIHAFTQHYIDVLTSWGNTTFAVHDSSAIMAFLHPELFESKTVCVDVETKGELTAGATVADWKGHWQREANTKVLMGVNTAAFHDLYIKYIARYAEGGPLASHVAELAAAAADA